MTRHEDHMTTCSGCGGRGGGEGERRTAGGGSSASQPLDLVERSGCGFPAPSSLRPPAERHQILLPLRGGRGRGVSLPLQNAFLPSPPNTARNRDLRTFLFGDKTGVKVCSRGSHYLASDQQWNVHLNVHWSSHSISIQINKYAVVMPTVTQIAITISTNDQIRKLALTRQYKLFKKYFREIIL